MIKLNDWYNHQFTSSAYETLEWKAFSAQYKKALKKQIGINFDLINFSREHFFISGFIQSLETKKLVYFSISDVRYFQDEWFNHILIRTAEHIEDWTGGCNNFTNFENIQHAIVKLLK